MALSEYEKRVLGEIEDELSIDSPRLASSLRSTHNRRRARRAVRCSVQLLAGVALVLVGTQTNSGAGTLIAVIGYAITVATLNAALPT